MIPAISAQMYREVNNHFTNQQRITIQDLRSYLKTVYAKYNYNKAAYSTDIKQFGFDYIQVKLRDKDYNRVNGLILLKL